MHQPLGFLIDSRGPISLEVRRRGFAEFEELAEHIRSLRYGRISEVMDPLCVLREERGTCSSKHRLLAMVAREQGHNELTLRVGIYQMSERNTPGVGRVLVSAGLSSIPEAHCYIATALERFDFTGLPLGDCSPFDSILEDHVVEPDDLLRVKIALHKKVIATWAASCGLCAESAWRTREACIEALTANSRWTRHRAARST